MICISLMAHRSYGQFIISQNAAILCRRSKSLSDLFNIIYIVVISGQLSTSMNSKRITFATTVHRSILHGCGYGRIFPSAMWRWIPTMQSTSPSSSVSRTIHHAPPGLEPIFRHWTFFDNSDHAVFLHGLARWICRLCLISSYSPTFLIKGQLPNQIAG